MDSNQQFPMAVSENTTAGISNQIIIFVLLALLILSFLGINLLTMVGTLVEMVTSIVGPLIAQLLSIFGYTTGSVLNKTADVVGDVAKTGVDVAEGSLQSVGNILKDASRKHVDPNAATNLDAVLNVSPTTYNDPAPSPSESPIQKPITAGKSGWCLVGEYEGKRGCIQVGEQDRCLSGQIFGTQNACLNPGAFTNQGQGFGQGLSQGFGQGLSQGALTQAQSQIMGPTR